MTNDDDAVVIPGPANRELRQGAYRSHRAVPEIDPFELPGRIEGDGLTVRGPEHRGGQITQRGLGNSQWPRRLVLDAAHPQPRAAILPFPDVDQLTAIW